MGMKIIHIKFKGIDDWNRPVYKQVDKNVYFGSVNTLIPDHKKGLKTEEDINRYFHENSDELELFGTHFNCEPHGGKSSKWKFVIVN